MKKNKVLIIIFSNLLILGLLFASLNWYIDKNINDIGLYLRTNKGHNAFISYKFDESKIDINDYDIEKSTVKNIDLNNESLQKFCGEDRNEFNTDKYSQKKPIVILGCSYAYGHGLQRNQTFPYLLSGITQRPIYNFSHCGGDASLSLFEALETPEKLKKADYTIYLYMHDHINRYLSIEKSYRFYEYFYPIKNRFEEKLIKIPLFRFIFSCIKIKRILKNYPETNESSLFLKNIMLVIWGNLKKVNPNTKFIIVLYEQKIADMYNPSQIKFDYENQNSKIWDELQQETDITVVHSKDIVGFLFDKDYKLKEDIADWHPNEKAWEVFTLLFAKKYIK